MPSRSAVNSSSRRSASNQHDGGEIDPVATQPDPRRAAEHNPHRSEIGVRSPCCPVLGLPSHRHPDPHRSDEE
jgi:hypothetical protein